MKKIWFKRKIYGWGWVPATLEGWVVTFVYIILFVLVEVIFINNVGEHQSFWDVLLFFLIEIILIAGLIYVCYKKGEKPKWSWGNSDEENRESRKD